MAEHAHIPDMRTLRIDSQATEANDARSAWLLVMCACGTELDLLIGLTEGDEQVTGEWSDPSNMANEEADWYAELERGYARDR